MRFYGLKPWELDQLDERKIEQLWEAVTILEAQETLMEYGRTMFPHLTKSARSERHKTAWKAAYPTSLYPAKSISAKELQNRLNGGRRGK